MKTGKIIKKPDYIGTLRRFSVGEAQTFKLVGLDYSSLRVAILRLNKREEGEWSAEIDRATNEMTVTRVS